MQLRGRRSAPGESGDARRFRARTEPRQSQPRFGLPETPRPHPKSQRTGALYKLPHARRSAPYRERRESPLSGAHRTPPIPTPPRPPRDSASPVKTPEGWRTLQASARRRSAPGESGDARRFRARTELRQSQPRLGLPETPRPHPKSQRTGALYKLPHARRSAPGESGDARRSPRASGSPSFLHLLVSARQIRSSEAGEEGETTNGRGNRLDQQSLSLSNGLPGGSARIFGPGSRAQAALSTNLCDGFYQGLPPPRS